MEKACGKIVFQDLWNEQKEFLRELRLQQIKDEPSFLKLGLIISKKSTINTIEDTINKTRNANIGRFKSNDMLIIFFYTQRIVADNKWDWSTIWVWTKLS